MKRITILLIISITIISCNVLTDDEQRDIGYGNLINGHYIYYGDFGYIDDPDDNLDEKVKTIVIDIIRDKIKYKEIKELVLADVEEIWKRGWADCDGYSLVLLNILYTELGIEDTGMILYLYIPEERTITEGGEVNHGEIYIGDRYYSAQSGERIYPIKIGYRYKMQYAFSATFWRFNQ